jgi:hypothetical protein
MDSYNIDAVQRLSKLRADLNCKKQVILKIPNAGFRRVLKIAKTDY